MTRAKRELPEDLIIKIMLNLPVKSLARFKCLSKSWLSIISDPTFGSSHFELASAPTTPKLMVMMPSIPELQSIDFNASLQQSATLIPKFPTEGSRMRGSCRGFLLFECKPYLYIWNPSTGLHKRIPCSPMETNPAAMVYTFLYGFAYDPSTDDYLVVQVYDDLGTAYAMNVVLSRVEIFSFRANAWEQMHGTRLSYSGVVEDPDGDQFGLLLHGAIHWLAHNCVDGNVNVALAFDIAERSFSDVPLPPEFECDFINQGDLWVIGGFLSLWLLEKDSTVIWIMQEYKVQSSWIPAIVLPHYQTPARFFCPICFSPNGEFLGFDDANGLVKCDQNGRLLDYRTFAGDVYPPNLVVYTESLLPLPGVSQEGEEDH